MYPVIFLKAYTVCTGSPLFKKVRSDCSR